MADYKNGNTIVFIDPESGTKIRYTKDDEYHPEYAESMDCTITYKCDGLCSFCYAGCTPEGKEVDFHSPYIEKFINSLHPYTEIALNGNLMDTPYLEEFLKKLKDRKVIANITVNQRHFKQNKKFIDHLIDEELIYGLGISLNDSSDNELWRMIPDNYPNVVIHTIAGILTPTDIANLIHRNLKVLFLGYKDKGRGTHYHADHFDEVGKNIEFLKNFLKDYKDDNKLFKVMSFDNLALEQLEVKNLLSEEEWKEFYMGDEGQFTFFVDLVNNTFATDSLTTNHYNINDMDAVQMFQYIQKHKEDY